ncbi:AP-4 complex accessory subunit Tepsin [Aplysia californica]|uniref:AP-4 complex accessory subunit Tepsin n=1 Tax=Aplysia californica TaxID=6500 RepID=A0ABM0JSL5_APLCA|nr:AP-4 complex accessory subunit Tepsin [Aplysia californica]
MANTAINFTAQRISFVNKIGLILKATSDDEQPTQAYLYKEINAISYESVGYSESLVEFLMDRLKSKSSHVKFKVLKVVQHLCEHGSPQVKLGLRKSCDLIKECTKFGGPPHPIHGNVPYTMVRKLAQEVCAELYNMDPLTIKSMPQDLSQEPKYGGLGSSRTGGAIQGFGNSPIVPTKGLGETILGGIEKLGAKISETSEDRQAALLARLDLSGSTVNYQPPVVSLPESAETTSSTSSAEPEQAGSGKRQVQARKHQPGRAGGGWNDDEEDEKDDNNPDDNECERNSDTRLSIDTDSLADPADKLIQDGPQADWAQERQLVTGSLQHGSTGPRRQLLAPSDLSHFLGCCARLSAEKVVQMIAQRLTGTDPGVVIRALQLLEAILYSREELVHVDLLTSVCKQDLVDCYRSCGPTSAPPGGETASKAETMTAPLGDDEEKHLWQSVRMKVTKVILILQQLSSHREILALSELADFLPKRENIPETPA